MSIKKSSVKHFQLYPGGDAAEGYAVGFEVEALGGGEKFYIDTIVPLAEAEQLSKKRIAELAWNMIRDQAVERADQLATGTIIGEVVESDADKVTYQEWDAELSADGQYNAGSIVTHNDDNWISMKDSNKSEPGVKDWQRYFESESEPATPSEDATPIEPEPATPPEEEATPFEPATPDEDATPSESYPQWVAGATYHRDDVVEHNDQLWISLKDDNKSEPGVKDWALYA